MWLDDGLVDEAEAKVSVFDHGLTVGDAVFETISVRSGRAVAATRHLRRLVRSAEGLGMASPDPARLHAAVAGLIEANQAVAGVVRVVVTSGPGPLGSTRGEAVCTVVAMLGPAPGWPPTADVVTVPWARNERSAVAGIKTTSYAENVLALAEARRRGGSEALFPNTVGDLCEGSGSNVFLVLEGNLVTPPLSSGCLAGVSRGLLIERCGLVVEERPVPMSALERAEEVFLTSATRDVQPVRSVDGRPLGADPGPVTAKASAAYAAMLATDPDPD